MGTRPGVRKGDRLPQRGRPRFRLFFYLNPPSSLPLPPPPPLISCGNPGCVVISDEVYEHLVFPAVAHVSIATLPGMADRCVRVGSAGKTFSFTGFKVSLLLRTRERER